MTDDQGLCTRSLQHLQKSENEMLQPALYFVFLLLHTVQFIDIAVTASTKKNQHVYRYVIFCPHF